jgi:hypothetical protein
MSEEIKRCYCGRELKEKWGYIVCPEHGACWRNAPIKLPKREKIGKWSGKSKSQNAWNDYQ